MTNSISSIYGASASLSAYSAPKSDRKEQSKKTESAVETKEWKGLTSESSLIPTTKTGYGTVIGDVKLSDKAKEYYAKLKEKFNGADFILVSKDNKEQVEKNASRYGSSAKPVVLIDDEKIEMCKIVTRAGADYIKTSTGFGGAGATFADIELFSKNIGEGVKMKAAGGISSLEDAEKFLSLGASRLGTSRIVKIAKSESGSGY